MLLTKPQKTMLICLCFIAGIGAYFLNVIGLFIIISAVLISFLFYKKILSAKFSVLCLAIIGISFLYCWLRTPTADELHNISPANIYMKGRVLTEPKLKSPNTAKFEFLAMSYKNNDSEWKDIKAKTLINIYDKKQKFKEIQAGDILEVKGFVKPPQEATNPGQFNYKNYLKTQRIFTLTRVKYDDFRVIEHPKSGKWFLIQNLNKIRNKIVSENAKYIKSPKLEVMEGMVFGDFAVPAPDDVKQNFTKSGLLHLLAASGMNVAFIFGAWYFIASLIRLPYSFKMIAGAIFVAFYSLLTGMPPSIMRAATMAEFLILAKLLDRKADTLIVLVLVCALMLLIDPYLIANISFQLSFLTTFGLILCVQPLLEKLKPVPEAISGIIIVPFIAQIWATPLQIFYFNTFSTYSLLANILVVPFVGIITFLGFIGGAFVFVPVIGGEICRFFDKIAEPVIDVILFISKYVSSLPNALYYFAKPEIAAIIIFYGFVIALLFVIKENFSSKKLNTTALILFISLLIFAFNGNFDKKLEFVFFDVGQGDAILVRTPDNKNILVDTGPSERYLPANAIIVPYLRDKGINTLDAVVLTHTDSDHSGGVVEILKNIRVNNVFHNGLERNSKPCIKIKNYLEKNKIYNKILYDGETINIDKNVNIKVIRPDDKNKNDANDDSIILYISYKEFSALLMADNEAESLYNIQNYVKEPVNIIKIGHHGSYKSVNYNFLNYLKPELAVISVGRKGYKYGHPNNKILQELNEFNVKTFRTDNDYAITVKSDGKSCIYKTFKKDR